MNSTVTSSTAHVQSESASAEAGVMRSSWRMQAAAVSAVAIVLAASTTILWRSFNAPPGQVGLEFPFDFVFYYVPMLQQAAERMRAGELPLWNPYQCCGVPFLATAQVGVFYPPNWLTLVLPLLTAIKVILFGQVLAAGFFAAMFFRALGKEWFAAAVGGLLYVFSCVLGQIYWPSEVSTLVWLPMLFWCVERFVQTRRMRWWVLFTLGVAMQLLAGFPQFTVYTFYLLGPYALVRLICERKATLAAPQAAGAARTGILLLAGCTLAAGLAAAQLVPTAELVRSTARGGPLTEKAVHYLEAERGEYFHPLRYLDNMFDPRPKMITFDFPDGSGYLGMLTPLLVGVGLLLGWRDHRVRIFVVAAAVTFLLAFGYSRGSAWAYRIYAMLPTGNMFRTPSRFLLLTHFSLVCIAVFGLDRVVSGLRELRGSVYRRVLVAMMMLAMIAAAQWASGDLGVRAATAAVLLVAAAYVVGNRPAMLCAVRGLIALVLVLDLAGATAPYGSMRDIPVEWAQKQHWGGVSPFDPAQRADVVRQAGLDRVALPGLRPTKVIEPPQRYYAVTEYEPLLPERWHSVNAAMGGEPGFVMCMIDPDRYAAFYDMASVAWLFRTNISDLARRRMGPRQWEIHNRVPRRPPAGMSTVLEHRSTTLPRAYLVSEYELCAPEEAMQRFIAADFDYRDGVLLETRPEIASVSGLPREPANITTYSPQRVVVQVDAAQPRILVLTDTFFPGWQARVDGAETPILRANYLFRAVIVPAGKHEVVFAYRPASVRAGACASVASIVALIVIAWILRQRRCVRSGTLRSY